jgi:hypothetical protein
MGGYNKKSHLTLNFIKIKWIIDVQTASQVGNHLINDTAGGHFENKLNVETLGLGDLIGQI